MTDKITPVSEKRPSSAQSYHTDSENGQAPELKRTLKARHLQMIAIGKFDVAVFLSEFQC